MIGTMTFAEWLATGHEDLGGTVSYVNASGRAALIKPDDQPEEWLFFSTDDWPVSARQQRLDGRRVRFDVRAQAIPKHGRPIADNVRFEDSARAE